VSEPITKPAEKVGKAFGFLEWKGTASAVPQETTNDLGFSP
jgi:hypothetical protein